MVHHVFKTKTADLTVAKAILAVTLSQKLGWAGPL